MKKGKRSFFFFNKYFCLNHMTCMILVLQPRIEPAWSPNHWIIRKFPPEAFLKPDK